MKSSSKQEEYTVDDMIRDYQEGERRLPTGRRKYTSALELGPKPDGPPAAVRRYYIAKYAPIPLALFLFCVFPVLVGELLSMLL